MKFEPKKKENKSFRFEKYPNLLSCESYAIIS